LPDVLDPVVLPGELPDNRLWMLLNAESVESASSAAEDAALEELLLELEEAAPDA
jgi:hypothetical protein